jgi:hypothetical protein
VDGILSNFLVSRFSGEKASGRIKVMVENYSVSQNISSGTIFSTPDGLNFLVQENTRAVSSPGSQDIKIFRGPGDSGYFFIPVIAESSGTKYNIKKDTQLSIGSPVFGFVNAVAAETFSSGSDTESTQSVFNRITESLSARNLASPVAIRSTLKTEFPEITQIVPHGVNSKSMTRNSANVFGLKSGCACDVYVKTSSYPETKSIRVIASKISDPDSEYFDEYEGMFLARVGEDLFPGHYDVISVSPYSESEEAQLFPIQKKARGLISPDLTENTYSDIQEVAFSSHSYTDVIFNPSPLADSVDEYAVSCSVVGIPKIKEIQDFVNEPDKQSALIDTLIRGCVPCFIEIRSLSVAVSRSEDIVAQDIQSAVMSYISSINPSTDDLRVDRIVSIVSSIPGVLKVDLPLYLIGKILLPTSEVESLSLYSDSVLEIPENVNKYVTRDTVGFFTSSDLITVKIRKI